MAEVFSPGSVPIHSLTALMQQLNERPQHAVL